jgi:Flp pilus assembly protein TadB
MDDRRRFEHDSAARQRSTGEPSARQILVLVAVTAVVTSATAAFLQLGLLATFLVVVVVVGMLVLGAIGSVILKRADLRRHR